MISKKQRAFNAFARASGRIHGISKNKETRARIKATSHREYERAKHIKERLDATYNDKRIQSFLGNKSKSKRAKKYVMVNGHKYIRVD